jgi:predicted phage terminase large subunit-like protein
LRSAGAQAAAAAARELLRRDDARSNLLAFTQYTMPSFEAAGHHAVICEALEEAERGVVDRLLIEVPPRHSKSELGTLRLPAWALGRRPNRKIITASYGAELATDFGRKVRNIVASPEYQRIFPGVILAADAKASGHWETTAGGIYVASGVGGALTGFGGDLVILDDPIKSQAEADSETYRERVWDWYRSVLYTRKMPGFVVVVIMTRWHEDDIAGRLLDEEEKGGDKWRRVKLPGIIAENTDKERALWPERYPLEELKRTRKAVGPRVWRSLYQQEPTAEQGDYFKREWFKFYQPKNQPKDLHKYGASDYAVTDGGGDFSEHGVFGLDVSSDVYVLDWWRDQTSSDVWIDSKLDLVTLHKPFAWFGESGVIEKAVQPLLTMRMRERKVHFRMEWLSSIHDKAIRARAFQALCASGRVWIPDTPEGHRLVEQLVKFPAGKLDDSVDVCSLFGRALDQTHPAVVRRDSASGPKDRWRDLSKRKRDGAESWRTV